MDYTDFSIPADMTSTYTSCVEVDACTLNDGLALNLDDRILRRDGPSSYRLGTVVGIVQTTHRLFGGDVLVFIQMDGGDVVRTSASSLRVHDPSAHQGIGWFAFSSIRDAYAAERMWARR